MITTRDRQAALVVRLYAKAKAGELKWDESPREETYQVAFPRYSVLIFKRYIDDGHSEQIVVQVTNEYGKVADEFTDDDLGGMSPDAEAPERNWFSSMKALFEMARRSALGADQALEEILRGLM